jgi:hypothetical protein
MCKGFGSNENGCLVEGFMTFIMCMLQMIMSPSFFNIMTHLIFHLVEELESCDPMDNNWHRVILNGQKNWNNYRVHAIIPTLVGNKYEIQRKKTM